MTPREPAAPEAIIVSLDRNGLQNRWLFEFSGQMPPHLWQYGLHHAWFKESTSPAKITFAQCRGRCLKPVHECPSWWFLPGPRWDRLMARISPCCGHQRTALCDGFKARQMKTDHAVQNYSNELVFSVMTYSAA